MTDDRGIKFLCIAGCGADVGREGIECAKCQKKRKAAEAKPDQRCITCQLFPVDETDVQCAHCREKEPSLETTVRWLEVAVQTLLDLDAARAKELSKAEFALGKLGRQVAAVPAAQEVAELRLQAKAFTERLNGAATVVGQVMSRLKKLENGQER